MKLVTLVSKRTQRGGNIGWASLEPDGRKRMLVGAWERSQGSDGSSWEVVWVEKLQWWSLKAFSPVCRCTCVVEVLRERRRGG